MLRAILRAGRLALPQARPLGLARVAFVRGNQQASADSNSFAADDKLRRALLYRSKQRGARSSRRARLGSALGSERVARLPARPMCAPQAGSRWTSCSATGRAKTCTASTARTWRSLARCSSSRTRTSSSGSPDRRPCRRRCAPPTLPRGAHHNLLLCGGAAARAGARAAHATPRRPPRAAPARQADSEVMQMLIGDLRTQMNEYTTVKSPKGSWEGKVWE